jgi:hypothetical protein
VDPVNGQDHAHEAEKVLNDPDRSSFDLEGAQIHATLAVAYAQAGAWKDTPSPTPVDETAADLTCGALHPGTVANGAFVACVRARRHDGNHVTLSGFDWADT